ncbi:MAG: hypothetical protein GY722_21450 [bacterium]|nr:hypothetical protein [bacterium]
MSVMALEGYVKDGRIRLTDNADLPDKAKVYVVVADASPQASRIWSPRLADPRQIEESSMEVKELSQDDSDAEV